MASTSADHRLGPEERASEQFARRVRSLRDLEPRFAYVRHTLQRMTPATVAGILAIASGRAELRQAPHPQLLLAMTVTLITDPPLRRMVLQAAVERGLWAVVAFLGTQNRVESAPPPASREQRSPSVGTRPLTLGERKSLARTNDRQRIAAAARDPHPSVVAVVLKNPFLTEEEVVRLCASRPMERSVLVEIVRHPKWIVRYRVIRAIVLNPHTGLDISVPLSAHLTVPDARLVASSPALPAALRKACLRGDALVEGSRTIH